jgi:hypothetical protein
MIISASRRTDIPAFYTPWFMNRIREGYCSVPNPYNPSQIATVSLHPEDVDVIVFWTRNPSPLLPHLKDLDSDGHHYYFLCTIMDNPPILEPHSATLEKSTRAFRALADMIGPEKVIWRYDPIVFTRETTPDFHKKEYEKIARELRGHTTRCIISTLNLYKKTSLRLKAAAVEMNSCEGEEYNNLMAFMAQSARHCGMAIFSCAQEGDLAAYGIRHGKCIDDRYIKETFGLEVTSRKDPSQRRGCGCIVSKDIGMYDSCLFGCVYCYATSSLEKARENQRRHDQEAPSLIPQRAVPQIVESGCKAG